MATARRGYLLIALLGLVIAGLLSLLAIYLATLLVWMLVNMLLEDAYRNRPLLLMSPVLLAASTMPLWGVWIHWSVLSGVENEVRIRRSRRRLLAWSAGIYIVVASAMTALTWPEIDADFLTSLAVMTVVGLVAAAPLVALLMMRNWAEG